MGFKECGEFSAELSLYNSNCFSFLSYLETLSRSKDESFLELQLHYKTVAISDAISVIYTGNSSPEGWGEEKCCDELIAQQKILMKGKEQEAQAEPGICPDEYANEKLVGRHFLLIF